MGTPHPFVHLDSSFEGGWVVACQARWDTNGDGRVESGSYFDDADALVPFLFTSAGTEEVIEELVGSDDSGRYVAFVQNRRVYILDGKTGERRDLSWLFGKMDHDREFAQSPALDFVSSGRVLAVRRRADSDEIVIVDLESDSAEVLFRGYPGERLDMAYDFFGSVRVWSFIEDTDGSGVVEPPPRTTMPLRRRQCFSGIACSMGRPPGDAPAYEVVLPIPRARKAEDPEESWCRTELPTELRRAASGAALVGLRLPFQDELFGPVQWLARPAHYCGSQRLRLEHLLLERD